MTGIYHNVIGLGVTKGEMHSNPFIVALVPLKFINHKATAERTNKGIMRIILFLKKLPTVISLFSPKLYFLPNKQPEINVNNPKQASHKMAQAGITFADITFGYI